MSKSEDYRDEKGSFVWRTVGGRRIKIYDGQSLSDAMKSSGKFKNAKKKVDYDKRPQSDVDKENERNNKAIEKIEKGKKDFDPNDFEKWREEVDPDYEMDDDRARSRYESYKDANVRNKEATQEKSNKLPSDVEEKLRKQGYNESEIKNATNYYTKDSLTSMRSLKEQLDSDARHEQDIYRAKQSSIKSQQSDIEKASGLKVEKAFQTDLYGNGKEDRFRLEDGRWVAHTTESMGEKEDRWSINKVENGSIESQDFESYDDMIKHLGGSNNSTKSFADEVKNYKPKDQKGYHSAKETLLNSFYHTYNDGDTNKDAYEKRMNNVKVLEESEDYVLYASKDENGFVNIQEVTSWDPKSRFDRPPQVYFEQDYKGNIKAGSATVNWAAYGSQNPETTKEFIGKLTKAQEFADKINKGKDYSKMWSDSKKENSEKESDWYKQTMQGANTYKKAFEEYKKKHPNTKLNLVKFINMSEGK